MLSQGPVGEQPLEIGEQPVKGCNDVFGNCPDVGEDSHEIVVAVPAGNNVEMEMVGNASAGTGAEIASDVEPIRREMRLEDGGALCKHLHDGRTFGLQEFG